jgi:hypothetical protein
MTSCMRIGSRSFFGPSCFFEEKYTTKDMAYMMPANTITMSRFGPSGSLNNENVILEQATAVMTKMSNEDFFERCILVEI